MQVLFVCTGNTCRSPMAEVLLRRQLQQLSQDHSSSLVKVKSAGLFAFNGQKASDGSIIAMKNRDIELGDHLSTQLTQKDVNESDLILTMTTSHKEQLMALYEDSSKIFTIKEFAGEDGDIKDPYGGTLEEYENTADELERLIKKIATKIKLLQVKKEDENGLKSSDRF